jgi:hypothetical protein
MLLSLLALLLCTTHAAEVILVRSNHLFAFQLRSVSLSLVIAVLLASITHRALGTYAVFEGENYNKTTNVTSRINEERIRSDVRACTANDLGEAPWIHTSTSFLSKRRIVRLP